MAAPSQYYVDYGAGNDTTGNGTSGTPWKTIQTAVNTVTRDATNGDQININAGTAQVLAAALSLTTYGAPGATSPLILRGYTASSGDGGVGEIDCNGTSMFASSSLRYIVLSDLKIHNFGNNNGVYLSSYTENYAVNCEIYKGASSPTSKTLVYLAYVIGCHWHGLWKFCQQLHYGGQSRRFCGWEHFCELHTRDNWRISSGRKFSLREFRLDRNRRGATGSRDWI
ncbi:MAG: hypothetical protein IPL70_13265 [Uliginosibacterium sp.]|nr:hypothetical protein [Uliginosibacterium sp.]